MRNPRDVQAEIVQDMTKAELDAQTIRQRDEQIKRLHAEVMEYIKVEKVMVAAGAVSKEKIEQAHEIVRSWS